MNKSLYIFFLVMVIAGKTAGQTPPTMEWHASPHTIEVPKEGGEFSFRMIEQYRWTGDYVYDPLVPLQNIIFPKFIGPADSTIIISPANDIVSPLDPDPIPIEWYVIVYFNRATDDGHQVEKIYSSSAFYENELDRIIFKPNLKHKEVQGTIRLYYTRYPFYCYTEIAYTQEALPRLDPFVITGMMESGGTAEILEGHATPYDELPIWQEYENGEWVDKTTANDRNWNKYKVNILADDSREYKFVRIRVKAYGQVSYSNICTVRKYKDGYQTITYTKTAPIDLNGKFTRDYYHYDGLGRLSQQVGVAAAGDGSNLITPIVYDVMQRADSVTLLPFKSPHNYLADPVAAHQATHNWEQDNRGDYPFYTNIYDNSGLGRLEKSMLPGRFYQGDFAATKYEYGVNNSQDRIAHLYHKNKGVVYGTGQVNYRKGTLSWRRETNADGISRTEYYDLQQRLIAEKITGNDGDEQITYYIYDIKGQLRAVLTPEFDLDAHASFFKSAGLKKTSGTAPDYCYFYEYDTWGRMTMRKAPGREEERFWYDNGDRMYLYTDGNLRVEDKALFYKYDGADRITHEYIANFDGYDQIDPHLLLARYEYDNYDAVPSSLSFDPILNYDPNESIDDRVKGLKTYEEILILEENQNVSSWASSANRRWVKRAYYYDRRGRVIQIAELNHLGNVIRTSRKYDLANNILKECQRHYTARNQYDEVTRDYAYDSRNRMTSEVTRLNNSEDAMMRYEYDDQGRLGKKRYGTDYNVFDETYSYNSQQRPSGRYSPYFSEYLYYDDPMDQTTAPSFAGNITEIEWTDQSTSYPGTKYYDFEYDQFGRLHNSFLNLNGSRYGAFEEKGITYDSNGNILHLSRISENHDLDLNYTYAGNQLQKVLLDNATMYYSHDKNGNMIYDGRQVLLITYNFLNLVQKVYRGSRPAALYTWLSDGTKAGVRTGDGLGGYEYTGSLVYQRVNGNLELEGTLFSGGRIQYFEGEHIPFRPKDPPRGNSKSYYYLTDHLGSVRVVMDAYKRPLVKGQNYYPFGLKWEDPGSEISTERYAFNGQEEQVTGDLDYLDFGARMYDPVIGRWFSMDPMLEKYYPDSPYAFSGNNPVLNIDPDGMDWYSFWEDIYDDDGNKTGGRRVYEYTTEYFSQRDLDKAGIAGTYLGPTFYEGNTYYSLLGEIKDLSTLEGRTIRHIDNAIMKDWPTNRATRDPFDYGYEDFYEGVEPTRTSKIKSWDNSYAGATIYLNLYLGKDNNKGYFENPTGIKDKFEKNIPYFNLNIKAGYNAYIRKQGDPRMNIVLMVFPGLPSVAQKKKQAFTNQLNLLQR